MFESKTYAALLEELLSFVPGNVSKMEGSLIYNALSPVAYELEKAYIQMDYILAQAYMDTVTDYDYAVLRAAERGIVPQEATHAVVKAEFNVEVPIGTRFSRNAYNYIVTEKISDFIYKMHCEESGTEPNINMGDLTAITYVQGLETAKITEILIPGEDKESLESLKRRYFASFSSNSFGGNIASYKSYVNAIAGVGGVKVYPVWNGGGTVKLVVIGSDYHVPSEELIKKIQEEICPEPFQGIGMAPIGHDVTVAAAEGVTVSVASAYTFEDGFSFQTERAAIENAVKDYFTGLSKGWAEAEKITVYISRLEAQILQVEGIVDISGTTLNGSSENMVLSSAEIPILGEVSLL